MEALSSNDTSVLTRVRRRIVPEDAILQGKNCAGKMQNSYMLREMAVCVLGLNSSPRRNSETLNFAQFLISFFAVCKTRIGRWCQKLARRGAVCKPDTGMFKKYLFM
jgi:hypothetical protein